MATLEIVKEFPEYKYPGPRYRHLGAQSGEEFREQHFVPWLKQHLNDNEIIFNIDGFVAYPPGFFREFILGTAAKNFVYKEALKRVVIQCQSPVFRGRIQAIILEIT